MNSGRLVHHCKKRTRWRAEPERIQKAELESDAVRMKTGDKNSNNLRSADGTILVTESSNDLNRHLMKVKEERGKAGLQLNLKKTKIMTTEILHNFNVENEQIDLLNILSP